MIILITGASHTGKTLLMQRLLEEHHYPAVSMDHIKMGLIRSGLVKVTPEQDEDLTRILWPVFREMIKTAVENHQNMIIEGCYVPFNWRKDFEEQYLKEIDFICLGMTEHFLEKYYSLVKARESIIEMRLFTDSYTKEWLMEENRKTISGFQKAGEPVFLIDEDYEAVIEKLIKEK